MAGELLPKTDALPSAYLASPWTLRALLAQHVVLLQTKCGQTVTDPCQDTNRRTKLNRRTDTSYACLLAAFRRMDGLTSAVSF